MFTVTTHVPLISPIASPQPGPFWLLRDPAMFAVLQGIAFATAYAVVGATYDTAYQGRKGAEIEYGPQFNTKFTLRRYADSAVTGPVSFVPMEPQFIADADVVRGVGELL